MAWNLSSDRPVFIQIIDRLKLDIITGSYQPGDKLPSVRDLANEASVNPNTMQRALAELERKNVVVTFRTSGRTVTEDKAMIRETRNALVREQVDEFLKKMKEMGFEKEEIIELLKEDDDSGQRT